MADNSKEIQGGVQLLKTILQLIRYNIPPLIVGKSSIGKSYTIIQLTQKWRLPHSMLYIGSEKPENIEGIAKLVGEEGEYGKKGEDVLKFLKPYWFPKINAITAHVSSGRDIFNKYIKVYDNPNLQFTWTFDCLNQILISLMNVEYPLNSTEISVSLRDDAQTYLTMAPPGGVVLNSKPFTFKRTLETVLQVKTKQESTLTTEQAGQDDIRDMCMYLCTLLGYGNYWLILDELDKVHEHDKDKYAPLLHIVRERTLKNWTLIEINNKKGLGIPLSLAYKNTKGKIVTEFYDNVKDIIDDQIKKGLPLIDTRVIGIANETKNIESALFRRFLQVIMTSPMALEPPLKEANEIISCAKRTLKSQTLMDQEFAEKLGYLEDVNLQWQYGFLPKILNQTDKLSNYFYINFLNYYTQVAKKYTKSKDRANALLSSEVWEKTAIGKVYMDNFMGGDKDEVQNEQLVEFFKCILEMLYPDNENPVNMAGSGQLGENLTPIQQLRAVLEKQYQENPKLFWRKLENKLNKDFDGVRDSSGINPGKLTKWTLNAMDHIHVSYTDGTAGVDLETLPYVPIPGVREKIIPFIYGLILRKLNEVPKNKQIHTINKDLFNGQMKIVNEKFDELSYVSNFDQYKSDKGSYTLKSDRERHELDQKATKELFFGKDYLSRSTGERNSKNQQIKDVEKSLFGTVLIDGKTDPSFSLAPKIYKNKYFADALTSFMNNVLGDADKYMDFKRLVKSGRGLMAERYFDFLNTGWRKDYLQFIYDQHMINNPGSNDRIYKNLNRLFKL